MASTAVHPPERRRSETLLELVLRGGRDQKLCADVALATGAPHALVEDVFQEACLHATRTGACRGQSVGEVYSWLRTATHWRVLDQLRVGPQRFEVPVDGTGVQRDDALLSEGADVEAIARERQGELHELVELALSELNERQRKVAVMHAYGLKGPEIARRLRLSRRQVQRLKEQMLARARGALAAHAGSGCEHGDELVRRLAFGLASAREHADAELHMAGCESCAAVYRRLQVWHENVAALTPMPAAAATDPALVERALHKVTDGLGQLKQQLSDAGSQAKQHAAGGFARAVDYTPIAGARPGAAATVLAGCLALGGGAATFCVDQGVDPISGLVDVIQPTPSDQASEERAEQPPTHASPPTDATPPPVSPSTTPTPAPPEQQAAVTTTPEPPPPPPPEPTPPAVQFGEPATPASTGTPVTTASAPEVPAPVPKSGGTDLYGP